MRRTARTILGAALVVAGAAIGILALSRGGVTWQVLGLVTLLTTYGGHLISHSQMREIVGDLIEGGAQLIRAWRGDR